MKFLWITIVIFFSFNLPALGKKPVNLGKTTLFELHHGIGAFSLEERVSALEARISSLAKDRRIDINQLTTEEFENSTNVMLGDRVIVTLTDRDAKAVALQRQVLSQNIKNQLVKTIESQFKFSMDVVISFGKIEI